MTTNELRQHYLDFFKSKGHVIIPSASLLPENDPTTLFTGSGMQPMVPYLLGQKHPEGTRIADSQRCFRSVDMDEVGDNRHTTFFEMLGNWSLGDYFKKEQISWMFDFVFSVMKLDPARVYITVFRGSPSIGVPRDDESVTLWQEKFKSIGVEALAVDHAERDGMGQGKIFYYDETKNWWSRVGAPRNMPVGEPGGPDSEMFWDFSAQGGSASGGGVSDMHERSKWKDLPCHVNCDCGRFLEFGNNVFMQYVRTEQGFEPLRQQNVDHGSGLERMLMALEDTQDMFCIDVFTRARIQIEKLAGITYNGQSPDAQAFRVILDHLRAATFLIADGAIPSNKDQGYFTRRLIRRAVRFAHQLGIQQEFAGSISQAFIETYKDSYPELKHQESLILEEITSEEQKFRTTLALGLKAFEHRTHGVERASVVSGEVVFDLYQSYGFPMEVTKELAQERGWTIDEVGFKQELAKHQELSRAGAQQKFAGGLADHSTQTTRLHTANHLMLEALKRVLGRDVNQKGSNITAERLRFDFNYPQKMTQEQIRQVEDIVNEQVGKDLPVHFEVMDLNEAKAIGATGVFEDRYAKNVKVYKMGQLGAYYSQEICGGPHVTHTSQVGRIAIQKEESASAGIRRIKAVVEGGTDLGPGEEAQEMYPGPRL